MLRFVTADDRLPTGVTRREWLRIALVGSAAFGAFRPRAHAVEPAARKSTAPGFGKAKSVVLVYASGGQSQLETWDPKPDAPEEIRGEFGVTKTSVPGTIICEHLPRLAKNAHRYTIVRGVAHDDLDHGSATYQALTGRPHPRKSSNPPVSPNDFPTFGSMLKRVRPADRFPYTAVHVNGPALVPTLVGPGQFGGLLGREYDPLLLGDVSEGDVAVPNMIPHSELPPVRLAARRSLLESIDAYRRELTGRPAMLDMDVRYRQAYEMLSTPRCRQAFDLASEPEQVRNRYGRYRSGQACLLARKLVEAGVPWITVIFNHSNRGQDKAPGVTDEYGWDTHNDIFEAMKVHLMPRFDLSFAALLEELDERGLLDETLVVCMGEFGRAPRVALEKRFAGSTPGRKHWASVYSIVMAGAGVQHGAVYGASDSIASHPVSGRVGPWDVAATMFHALGIDSSSHFTTRIGTRFPLTIGQPIPGVYG